MVCIDKMHPLKSNLPFACLCNSAVRPKCDFMVFISLASPVWLPGKWGKAKEIVIFLFSLYFRAFLSPVVCAHRVVFIEKGNLECILWQFSSFSFKTVLENLNTLVFRTVLQWFENLFRCFAFYFYYVTKFWNPSIRWALWEADCANYQTRLTFMYYSIV